MQWLRHSCLLPRAWYCRTAKAARPHAGLARHAHFNALALADASAGSHSPQMATVYAAHHLLANYDAQTLMAARLSGGCGHACLSLAAANSQGPLLKQTGIFDHWHWYTSWPGMEHRGAQAVPCIAAASLPRHESLQKVQRAFGQVFGDTAPHLQRYRHVLELCLHAMHNCISIQQSRE